MVGCRSVRQQSSMNDHLPGREPVGSKLLNKNVFFKDAAAPFLDALAPYRPCDYFLHVSSSDPNNAASIGERIIQRELNVQPNLEQVIGHPVSLMVDRTIAMGCYDE